MNILINHLFNRTSNNNTIYIGSVSELIEDDFIEVKLLSTTKDCKKSLYYKLENNTSLYLTFQHLHSLIGKLKVDCIQNNIQNVDEVVNSFSTLLIKKYDWHYRVTHISTNGQMKVYIVQDSKTYKICEHYFDCPDLKQGYAC